MKRGYSRDQFLQIAAKLRAAQPQMSITTDLIVGFPGETDADFEQTRLLMEQVQFDQAFIFKYSPRRDTPAADMGEQVAEKAKRERNQTLLDLLNATTRRKNEQFIGQTVEILVEGRSEKGGRRMFGRTRSNRIVVFDGNERHKGQLLPVRVESATATTLYATPAIHNL
jgi:tRNA-2-methylthio-N6-dimethylallyladenosine synthase